MYLEDSWVLEIVPSDLGLSFRLDVVLTPEHTLYEPPKQDEQYCYRFGWLAIGSTHVVDLRLSGAEPVRSLDGPDLGNIDLFVPGEAEGEWKLEGVWGSARIRHPSVMLVLD